MLFDFPPAKLQPFSAGRLRIERHPGKIRKFEHFMETRARLRALGEGKNVSGCRHLFGFAVPDGKARGIILGHAGNAGEARRPPASADVARLLHIKVGRLRFRLHLKGVAFSGFR